jgi:acyl-[acyl-carrier-protein]-phospholipid O-acyltransferase/long-chain-fatty-acid--[acyl-carrier-protein] ligase
MVLALLIARRFLPLFVTQFLGALNDNVFKNAMVVLLLWRAGSAGPVLVAAAGGVFILPYALFSGLAGELADRGDMARLARAVKLFEIALMALGTWGLLAANAWVLMAVLFGMGIHSTVFGPVKYALLPLQLHHDELVTGNGLVEAGTFLAILLGTILGGGLVIGGVWLVSGGSIAVAAAGYLAACFIPRAAPAAPGLKLDFTLWRGTVEVLGAARANREVWRAILAISWFWTVGATVLSQFPVVARDVLGADAGVVTLFLAVFSLGVGAGSMLEARLLKGVVSQRHAPLALLGISLFTADFVAASLAGPFATPAALLAAPAGWRIVGDLFLLAVSGGVFSVPLYALMQERAAVALRARVIAANNIVNALFMVAGAVVAAGLAAAGWGAPSILGLTAAANLVALVVFVAALPEAARPALLRRGQSKR